MTVEVQPPQRGLNVRQVLSHVAAILIALGIILAVFLFAPHIQQFRYYGYPGVFFISLIANASIFLPIPSLAITFTMGAVLNWFLVGLVAGIGEAIGETTGYLAGYGGAPIIENRRLYTRMQRWMAKYGALTIFILSVIPNPIIDLAGIAAGAAKYPFHKFFLTLWLGKTIKTLIFAWAGAHSLVWILQFMG